jgi:hypothetical protein
LTAKKRSKLLPRPKKSTFIPESVKTEVIPEDLQKQWGAAQACSTALALFDQGYFSARHSKHVEPSMGFLAKLHEQTVDQALRHPQAHMIPELKKILDEAKDGKKANQ